MCVVSAMIAMSDFIITIIIISCCFFVSSVVNVVDN